MIGVIDAVIAAASANASALFFHNLLLSLPKGCPLLPNYKKEQRKSRSCVITIDYPLLLFFCYLAVFYYILQRFSCQALFHFNLINL